MLDTGEYQSPEVVGKGSCQQGQVLHIGEVIIWKMKTVF